MSFSGRVGYRETGWVEGQWDWGSGKWEVGSGLWEKETRGGGRSIGGGWAKKYMSFKLLDSNLSFDRSSKKPSSGKHLR